MSKSALMLALCVFVFLCTDSSAIAQPLKKGSVVTLKVPQSIVKAGYANSSELLIEGPAGSVTANGRSDWDMCCFPSMLELKVREIKTTGKPKRVTEVMTYTETGILYVRFGPSVTEPESAFREITIDGSPSSATASAYLQFRLDAIGKKIFAGELAGLSDGKRQSLMRFVSEEGNGSTPSTQRYKENLYFVAGVGANSTFNTLQLNEQARVARMMNDQLFKVLKGLLPLIDELGPSVYGIKLEAKIPYKNFVRDEHSAPEYDALQLFVPRDALKKFADADITGQQLCDASIVIINDNRLQLSLSAR